METNPVKRLAAFFAEYEARMNRALAEPPVIDTEATAQAFADCFVEANPNGVVCGKNDAQLREAIPKGIEFYRSIGTRSMNIRSVITTPLDDYHAMSRVAWRANYVKNDASRISIDFEVIYFVQLAETPKIFCYITGDEQQAYRDHGLIPT